MREYLSVHTLGDTLVRFPIGHDSGRVGLELVPLVLVSNTVAPRDSLQGEAFIDVMPGDDPWPARPIDSLMQLKLVGDEYPGAFAQGHTMRNSGTVAAFRYDSQEVENLDGSQVIITRLRRADGCRLEHRLGWRQGESALTVETIFSNESNDPVTLEMLSSFSISGITPFHQADAPGRLRVHRFRSGWSAEGRHENQSVEQLHLERSWSGAGAFSERFGQLGTMPVRRWFPFVAAEDSAAGVFWGAALSWAGS